MSFNLSTGNRRLSYLGNDNCYLFIENIYTGFFFLGIENAFFPAAVVTPEYHVITAKARRGIATKRQSMRQALM